MENKKDIGLAISEKLGSLDKAPREQVWLGIEEELKKKKKRRFAFFFFWSKIAALLIIGALAVFYFYNQNDDSNLGSPKGSNDTTIVNDANAKNSGKVNNENQAIDNSESDTNDGIATIDEDNTNSNNSIGNDNHVEENNSIDSDNNVEGSSKVGLDSKAVNKNGFKKSNKIGNTAVLSPKSGSNSFSPIFKKPQNIKANDELSAKNNSELLRPFVSSEDETRVAKYTSQAKGEYSGAKGKYGKTKKSGKKNKPKTSNATDELLLAAQNKAKKDSAAVDLSSLKAKDSIKLAAETNPKKKDSVPAKKDKNLVKNVIMHQKEKKDSIPVLSYKKFDVDVFVTPDVYLNYNKSPSIGSPSDSLSRKSATKFGYGVGLTYDLSNKLSFRIGYSRINLSLTTNVPRFPVGENGEIRDFSGISYNPNASNYSVYLAADFGPEGAAAMDVTQKISYTEIPFEFKYKFIDKKFSLKTSVGFSYLILSENKVSVLTSNGYSQDIGKTKDMTDATLSFNLGVEIDYPIFKNLKLFVEPMFNYQVKAFTNSSFKPYYFGVHTGLRYSFNN